MKIKWLQRQCKHKERLCLLRFRLTTLFLMIPLMLFSFESTVVGAGTPRLQLEQYHWANTPRDVFLYCPTSQFTYAERETIRSAINAWNAIRTSSGGYMVSMYLTTNEEDVDGEFREVNVGEDYVAHVTHTESDGGALHYVDIKINTYYTFSMTGSSNAFDLRTTVQHELGHVLGVAHCHEEGASSCFSNTCTSNVMHLNIDLGEVRTTFQPYDTFSYREIYE